MSTIQLTVVTPDAFGAVAPPSRIDHAVDEALNILAWEAVIVLGMLIVLAPFALVGFAAWLGRRIYRRHEEGAAAHGLGTSRQHCPVRTCAHRPCECLVGQRRDERLATTLSGRPEIWLALRSRASLCLRESLALHENPLCAFDRLPRREHPASRSASSRSARSSSWRAVAVAIAGNRSLSRNGFW